MDELTMKEQLNSDRTKASVFKARQNNKASLGNKMGSALALRSSASGRNPSQGKNNANQSGAGNEERTQKRGGAFESLTQKMAQAGGPSGAALGAALGGGEGLTAGLHPASKEALKYSWLNLIDSVGFTFLYLILHFIVRYIAGSKSVCRFGEEGAFGLIPKEAQTAISAAEGEEGLASKGSEYAEIIVFLSLLIIVSVNLLIMWLMLMAPFLLIGGGVIGLISLIK